MANLKNKLNQLADKTKQAAEQKAKTTTATTTKKSSGAGAAVSNITQAAQAAVQNKQQGSQGVTQASINRMEKAAQQNPNQTIADRQKAIRSGQKVTTTPAQTTSKITAGRESTTPLSKSAGSKGNTAAATWENGVAPPQKKEKQPIFTRNLNERRQGGMGKESTITMPIVKKADTLATENRFRELQTANNTGLQLNTLAGKINQNEQQLINWGRRLSVLKAKANQGDEGAVASYNLLADKYNAAFEDYVSDIDAYNKLYNGAYRDSAVRGKYAQREYMQQRQANRDLGARRSYQQRLNEEEARAPQETTLRRKGASVGEHSYKRITGEEPQEAGYTFTYEPTRLQQWGRAIHNSYVGNMKAAAGAFYRNSIPEGGSVSGMNSEIGVSDQSKARLQYWSNELLSSGREQSNLGTYQTSLATQGLGAFGTFIVDASIAGVQMLMDMGISVVTGGSMLPAMFVRSMGGGYLTAEQMGASDEEALAYGIGVGAVEVLSEKMFSVFSIGNRFAKGAVNKEMSERIIDGLVKRMATTTKGRTALNRLFTILFATGSEGLEEVAAGIMEPVIRKITMDPKLDISSEIDWQEALYEGLIGGLLGGIGGAVELTNTKGTYWKYHKEGLTEGIDRYVATAKKYGIGSEEALQAAKDIWTAGNEKLNGVAGFIVGANEDGTGGKWVPLNEATTEDFNSGLPVTLHQYLADVEAARYGRTNEKGEAVLGPQISDSLNLSRYLENEEKIRRQEAARREEAPTIDQAQPGQGGEFPGSTNGISPSSPQGELTETSRDSASDEGIVRLDTARSAQTRAQAPQGVAESLSGIPEEEMTQEEKDELQYGSGAVEDLGKYSGLAQRMGQPLARAGQGGEFSAAQKTSQAANVAPGTQKVDNMMARLQRQGALKGFNRADEIDNKAKGVFHVNSVSIEILRELTGLPEEVANAAHEAGHLARYYDPELLQDVLDLMRSRGTDIDALVARKALQYQQRFEKAGVKWDPEEYDRDYFEEEVMAEFIGNICKADTRYLDMIAAEKPSLLQRLINFFRRLVYEATGDQRAVFEKTIERMNAALEKAGEAKGGGGERFTFGGENAVNADLDALGRAVDMDAAGTEMRDIFRETGWFKGMDGKWRFEIDDSKMKYRHQGDMNYMSDPEYREYLDLWDKVVTAFEPAEEEELERFYELDRRYKNVVPQAVYRVTEGGAVLSDIIEHEELFENYPQLRNAPIRFDNLPQGDKGNYNPITNELTLNRSLREAPEDTLVHEIQHALQSIEGFSEGASPEYWKRNAPAGEERSAYQLYRNTAGEIEARDVTARRKMSEEQRRNTMPDTGNKDTVFAEGDRFSFSEEGVKNIDALTEQDVLDLLERVENGDLQSGYIPLRRNTPLVLLQEASRHSGLEYDDLPIVSDIKHLRQMMDEPDGGYNSAHRPHNISRYEVIEIIKAMDTPAYIVYQANGRYAEVVRYRSKTGKTAIAAVELNNYKYKQHMNGYPSGNYNILVTAYNPDSISAYLENEKNTIIYDKKKGSLQSGSGGILTPSHLNSSPFANSVSQNEEAVKTEDSSRYSFEEDVDQAVADEMMSSDLRKIMQELSQQVSRLTDRLDGKTPDSVGRQGALGPVADQAAVAEPEKSTQYNNTVVLEEATVDKYLADYAVESIPNYAKAYITMMSPDDFLALTTPRSGRRAIDEGTKPLDTEELADVTRHQPFQLRINTETGEVIGHEGRHRMNALRSEGIENVPVLLFDSNNKYSKEAMDSLTLHGQDFGDTRSDASRTVEDVLPLSYANRDQIVERFATQPKTEEIYERYGRDTVRFSFVEGEEEPKNKYGIDNDVVKAIQSIGRKSVNRFTSAEINKTEKFARKFWEELGTKSPFFRAWFGDWRAYDTTPITIVPVKRGQQYKAGRTTIADTKRTDAGGQSNGTAISWGDTFKRETITHKPGSGISADIIGNIEALAQNAVLLDTYVSEPTGKSKMPGTAFMHSFYVLANDGTEISLFKLFAEEALSAKEEIFMRAYELKDIVKVTTLTNGVLPGTGGLTNVNIATINSVADLYNLVKTYDKQFTPAPEVDRAMLEDDGTPKKVYHQTAEEFWTFDNSNPAAGKYDSETPNGFFFKDNDHDIGIGGDRQMECYLRMLNPLHFADRKEANAWYCQHVDGYAARQKEMEAALKPFEDRLSAIEKQMFAADTTDEKYNQLDEEWNGVLEEMREAENEHRGELRSLLDDYFLGSGSEYDGIILDYDGHRYVDGKREDVKTYIVFEKGQAKSATDNIGTFDRSNPDVRYSFTEEEGTEAEAPKDLESMEPSERSKELMAAAARAKQISKQTERILRKIDLTEKEQGLVNALLSDALTVGELPSGINRRAVIQAYEAKKAARDAAAPVEEYNKQHRELLNEEARDACQNSTDWKNKKFELGMEAETPRRIFYGLTKDEAEAEKLTHKYVDPIRHHHAQKVRMIKEYAKQIEDLHIDKKRRHGNKVSEDYAVQYVGELEFIIDWLEELPQGETRGGVTYDEAKSLLYDFWKENPNLDKDHIRNAVAGFHRIYDEVFAMWNEARVLNGYAPVDYRKGYFPHFTSRSMDTIVQAMTRGMGFGVEVAELPTDIAGLTHMFKPGTQWSGHALQRTGNKTDYSALEGWDRYIETVGNIIYHTEDIQRWRALERALRYKHGTPGVREEMDKIRKNKDLTEAEREAEFDKLLGKDGKPDVTHLSAFVRWVNEYTNFLAGKRHLADRIVESFIGRNWYTRLQQLENTVGFNMLAGNIASVMTNFAPMFQALGGVRSTSMLQAIGSYAIGKVQHDVWTDGSDFLVNRKSYDPLYTNAMGKVKNAMFAPFNWVDDFVSEVVVRAKYIDELRNGASPGEAMRTADVFAGSVIADRTVGELPLIYNSKSLKIFTMFQVEVNNDLRYLLKDMPREARKDAKATVLVLFRSLLRYLLAVYTFNDLFEALFGRRVTFDPLNTLNDLAGVAFGKKLPNGFEVMAEWIRTKEAPDWDTLFDAEHSDKPLSELAAIGEDVAGDLPFVTGLFGGGRYPVFAFLPNRSQTQSGFAAWEDLLFTHENDTKYDWQQIYKMNRNALTYLQPIPFIPGGQVRRTAEGIMAAAKGGSYNLTKKGEILQYPILTTYDIVKSAIFGKNTTKGGKEWVKSDFDSLSVEETAAYIDLVTNGSDGQKIYDVLRDLHGDDRDAVTKAYALASANLKDSERIRLLDALVSESQGEKFAAMMTDGDLTFRQCAEVYEKYHQLSKMGELKDANDDYVYKKAVLATQFSAWLDDEGYSDVQKTAITEQYKFWNMVPAEAGNYEKLTGAGLSTDNAVTLTSDWSELEPLPDEDEVKDFQKIAVVASAGYLSEKEKHYAIRSLLKDEKNKSGVSPQDKYTTYVMDYHIPAEVYSQYCTLSYGVTGDDLDGDGTSDKYTKCDKLFAIIDRLPLSNGQKTALAIYKGGVAESTVYKRAPWLH